MHELQYGSPSRQLRIVARPVLALGLVVVAALALRAVVRRELSSEPDR